MEPGAKSTSRIGLIVADRYRITDALGRGGMGSVYRAEHVHIRRPVALKLLHPELVSYSEMNERFKREAFATGRVNHPNCVAITDSGTLEDGTTYLVMELLKGICLGDELDRLGRIDLRRSLHIVRHVLRGLAHAHAAGIVHRDLKPENVFLVERDGDRDFAKILDFGVAKLVGDALDAAGGQKLTQAGLTIGSPSYMSPEQAAGDDLDGRSDLYALSILLYEMLSGRRPFESDNKMDVVRMHLTAPPPPLSQVAPDVAIPPGAESLLRRGLAKPPAERQASAEAYLEEVEAILADLESAPGAPAFAPVPSSPGFPADPGTPIPGPPPMAPAPPRPGSVFPAEPGTPIPGPAPAGVSMPPSGTSIVTVPERPAFPGARGSRRGWWWAGAAAAVGLTIFLAASLASSDDHAPAREGGPGVAAGADRSARQAGKAAPDRSAGKSAHRRQEPPPARAEGKKDESSPAGEESAPREPDATGESPETGEDSAAASPFARLAADPDLLAAEELLQKGQRRAAERRLIQLRRQRPKDPLVAFTLGRVYFEKNWWRDGFENYRAAIRLEPAMRDNPVIIRDAIRSLESRRQHGQGVRFLVREIGPPAVPYLRETLEHWNNPRHLARVRKALNRIEAAR